MKNLTGKKVLLGVSGSIAAYKAAHLVRLLVKEGAEVQVLMTPAARDFISPLTLSTLSRRPVFSDVHSEAAWNNHVELGLWADVYLLAPLTANTLGKLAQGICDSVLAAVYLSARCSVFFAPAMDVDMWHHPATQRNVRQLQQDGHTLIPVGDGELASGLSGPGRMAEPEDIVALLQQHFQQAQELKGKRALVTAGPTHEPLDPVRFLGNHSSGKMGVAIAEALAARGAEVDLLLGPSALHPQHPRIRLQRVQTAQQMYEAAQLLFPQTDIAVMAAAVADYRPAQVAGQKLKKSDENLSIQLERTPDIAASLGLQKRPEQCFVGFALETEQEEAHALGKLHRKNFDFIVLNSLRDPGAGFQHDTNKVRLLFADNKQQDFQLKSKSAVAHDITDTIVLFLKSNHAL